MSQSKAVTRITLTVIALLTIQPLVAVAAPAGLAIANVGSPLASPPTASFTLSPGGTVTSLTEFTLTDTSTDSNGVIVSRTWTVSLVSDPTPDGVADTPGVILTSGAPSISFFVPDDGNYLAELHVEDDEMLSDTESLPFVVSNADPTPTGASPPFANPTSPASFLDQSFDRDGEIVLREWDMNGDGTMDLTNPGTLGPDGWAFTYQYPAGTPSPVTAVQRVVDDDGRGVVRTMTIVFDSIPPTTAVSYPTPGPSGWYRMSPVQLSVSRIDEGASGLKETTVTVDGDPIVRGGTAAFGVEVAGDGVHSVTYRSSDRAGNVEALRGFTLRIDTTPPAVKLVSPSVAADAPGPALFGGVFLAGETIPVEAAAADAGSGVVKVDFFVNGVPLGSDMDGSDGYTTSWNTAGRNSGSYEVAAVATNGAGLMATSSAAVVLVMPVSPPAVAGDVYAHALVVNDGDPVIGYLAKSGEEDVGVGFTSAGPSAEVTDGLEPFQTSRLVLSTTAFLLDGGAGGEARLDGHAFANGKGCTWQTWGADLTEAAPRADCNVASASFEGGGEANNDGSTPVGGPATGRDTIGIAVGPGPVTITDGLDLDGVLKGILAYAGLVADIATGGGTGTAGLWGTLEAEGASCYFQTWGGPVDPGYVPAATCDLP